MSDLWLPEALKPKIKYICMWRDGNGKYVVNEAFDFLTAESFTKGDKEVENKMRQAAQHYGVWDGKPFWREGRKITKTEWEVQMERMQDGLIPDEQEEPYVLLEEEYNRDREVPRQG